MTTRRKFALAAAGALALCTVLLALAPLLFRGPIEARVRSEVQKSVNARVAWGSVGISLLRDFPNASFRVDDLTIAGRGPFEGDTLARVPSFRLVLELPSVLRALRGHGAMVVRSVEVVRPVVHLRALEDGTANWDVLPEQEGEASTEPNSIALSLRSLEVRDATITLDDRKTGVVATVSGLDQSLSGDFRQTDFTLASRTRSEAVSLRFAGVPYVSRAKLGIDAELGVDRRAGRVTVRQGEVRLNGLSLALSGSVASAENSTALDLAFHAPGASFKEILSLVPAIYLRDGFADLRTTGTMAVSGWVRGGYGENAFPALSVQATVKDGGFHYPDLPLAAREIALDLSLTNPGGDLDRTVLSVRRAHARIGDNPIQGSLELRSPLSDPAVELQLAGRLDLADLRRTVRLPATDELAGRVEVDASVNARASDLDHQRYEKIGAEGTVAIADLRLKTADLPHPISVDEALLRLSPRFAEIVSLRGRAGKSDATVTGRLDNLLGFLLRDEELRGRARVESRFVDLNEWRSDDEAQAVPVPRNLDLRVEAEVDRLAFAELDIRNARGALRVKDGRAMLDDVRMEMLGGTLALSGSYDTTEPSRPTFDVHMQVADVDAARAFAQVATVRALAPVARYAHGSVSTDLHLKGALGTDMTPVYQALAGQGAFETVDLGLKGLPVLERLGEALKMEPLKNPVLARTRSSFAIREGRLHVSPFDVKLGDIGMTVSGSNGFDGSLDYGLVVEVPRRLLGEGANQAVAALARKTGRLGIDWRAADLITLGAKVGGTMDAPSVSTDFRGAARSVAQSVTEVARKQVEERTAALTDRADSVAEAEAARRLAEAEQQAQQIREEARRLADAARQAGYAQADDLVARAGNPIARRLAAAGADRLRKETDAKVDRMIQEADRRADALLETARARTTAGSQ